MSNFNSWDEVEEEYIHSNCSSPALKPTSVPFDASSRQFGEDAWASLDHIFNINHDDYVSIKPVIESCSLYRNLPVLCDKTNQIRLVRSRLAEVRKLLLEERGLSNEQIICRVRALIEHGVIFLLIDRTDYEVRNPVQGLDTGLTALEKLHNMTKLNVSPSEIVFQMRELYRAIEVRIAQRQKQKARREPSLPILTPVVVADVPPSPTKVKLDISLYLRT